MRSKAASSPTVYQSNLFYKKARHTKGIILRQPGCLVLVRPVAFRPPLWTGLALSIWIR